jgi:hypothetical protein
MENKSFVQNRMPCVTREAKAKFRRVIVLDEVEEKKKLHSTECMNNVMS